jgi:hypothetical protein
MKRSKSIDDRKIEKWRRAGALADINGPKPVVRQTQIKHCGIIITVRREGESYTTFFSNAAGEFYPLHHVKAIRNIRSRKEAKQEGIAFVDAHQRQFVEKIGVWNLYVQLWWNEEWGYVLDCEGSLMNHPEPCDSREDAVTKGRARARAEQNRFEREIAEDEKRIAERRARLAEQKPTGTFQCRACQRICDGSELYLDPTSTATRWTCSDPACGANVVKIADAPYVRS